MKTSRFSFDLPDHLIARHPASERGTCRIMLLHKNQQPSSGIVQNILHIGMPQIIDHIPPDTLMIFNDTRVRKARMIGTNAQTGGKSEFLFLHQFEPGLWECLLDRSKKKQPGQVWNFPGHITATIVARTHDSLWSVKLHPAPGEDWFENHGLVPLPPYIDRHTIPEDDQRYQTVYAKEPGSAAAPTAGLHFTHDMIQGLSQNGIQIEWVTLEVGAGTFIPVRTEQIEEHQMHTERYHVPLQTAHAIRDALERGRHILAVGTTTVRTLESAWDGNHVRSGWGSSNLFIYPGYRFNVVNALFTNFHTPESSLLMLVCAFAGYEPIMQAYHMAMDMEYRFFSYGDAMLIL